VGTGGTSTANVHIVQPGDTLWSIARRLQPEGDLRPLVDRLAMAHGGAALQVGERIGLPADA
jgi:LysM repeat protein